MVLFDAIAFGMLGCGGIAIILLFMTNAGIGWAVWSQRLLFPMADRRLGAYNIRDKFSAFLGS